MIPTLALSLIIGLAIASISRPLNDSYGFTDSLWPGLVGIMIASFGFIYVQANKHADRILGGNKINHYGANTVRIAVMLALSCLIHAYSFHWIKVINLMIFGGFWFGITFNLYLNHERFLPWDYIGKDGKNQAWTDSIFSHLGKQGGKILMLVEILGMAATGYVYLQH